MTLRVVELELDGQQTLELYEIEFEGAAGSGSDFLQIADLSLTAVAGTAPTLAAGTVSPAALVKAGTQVTMTVVGSGYDSIGWTLTSGSLAVSQSGSDLSKTFTAPYAPAGGFVEFSVVAENSGGDSPTVLMRVNVRAHLDFYLADDGQWTSLVRS